MGARDPRTQGGHRQGDAKAPPPSPLDVIDASYLAEARAGQELPSPTLPEVAFAGRSNVGKSTLLNRLCQRRALARTSRTPGCTRGLVIFRVTLRDATSFAIADLPGYGFAERSKAERDAWQALIERYLKSRASLAGVVILADARRGIEAEEQQLIDYLDHIRRPFLLALTKVDKLTRAERDRAIAEARRRSRAQVIGVSGDTGEGREEILRRIRSLVRFDPVPSQEGTKEATDGK